MTFCSNAPAALHVRAPGMVVPPSGSAVVPAAPAPPAAPAVARPTSVAIVQPCWPAPTAPGRMPDLTAGLVVGLLNLFDAEHGPRAEARIREALPRILSHFFPWTAPEGDGSEGLPFYLAECVLLYALQGSKRYLPQPHLRAFVDDFCAALSVARKITLFLERSVDAGGPIEGVLEGVVAEVMRTCLLQGRMVLCPGGANRKSDGHATMMALLPQPDGDVVCAVFNRGEGLSPWHVRDGDKARPWLALLPQEGLCAAAGAAALGSVLALLAPSAEHTVSGYYDALNALVTACAGTRLVSGSPWAEALTVPGQSLQKGNECTLSSALAAMRFLMQVQLRGFVEPPSCNGDEALAVHREIKHACRRVILREIVLERGRALQERDAPRARELTEALCQTAAAMRRRRDRRPGLGALYAELPTDVRCLAEAAD